MAWSSAARTPGCSTSASTICATGPTTGTRPWTTGRSAAAKAWCSSREPLFQAVESIWPERNAGQKVVLLSAQGRLFDQAMANRLSRRSRAAADLRPLRRRGRARGRAPGRRRDFDRQLRAERRRTGGGGGDRYGGAAAAGSAGQREFGGFRIVSGDRATAKALLDCPHWTRPAEFRGWKVPEVLLSGNHEEIRRLRGKARRSRRRRGCGRILAERGQYPGGSCKIEDSRNLSCRTRC